MKTHITLKELSHLIDAAPMNYAIDVAFGGTLITAKGSWEHKELIALRGASQPAVESDVASDAA